MNVDEAGCWDRLAQARHGVLATMHRSRGVDAVPVVFAVVGPGAPWAGPGVDAGVGADPGGGGAQGRRIVEGGGISEGRRISEGWRIVVPVDAVKPKRSNRLQRLVNLESDARCVLLVDHYEEDWSRLWWVRVHGHGAVSRPEDASEAVARLAERYPQYRTPGALVGVITLEPTAMVGWAGGAGDPGSTP